MIILSHNCKLFYRCTFCSGTVDEDESSEPKKDSRLQLAKFNTEMKPLYELLHQVESVRLAQSLLEPEPVEIESLLKNGTSKNKPKNTAEAPGGDKWSGGKWAELGKGGFNMETQKVQIDFDSENMNTQKPAVSIYVADRRRNSANTVSCMCCNEHKTSLTHYFFRMQCPHGCCNQQFPRKNRQILIL